jgi:hypothetical protein
VRITITRSGGITGRRVQQSVDTDAVPDGNTFESLVDGAALSSDRSPGALPTAAPDRFHYIIDVDGRESHFGETDLSETQRALIERVLGR